MDAKKKTMLLGLAFLVFLALSYVENILFFSIVGNVLPNDLLLAVAILFIHNILAISLIMLGLTFYVNLVVLNFFKREKYANIVLEHPRTFALVFTLMIVFLSILRGSSLLGGVSVEVLPLILFISAPVGMVEGYGIYLTIRKTLSRTMSMKDLLYIYAIFFIAAIIEVGFINLLQLISA